MLGNIPAASRGITWQVSSYCYCDTCINVVMDKSRKYYSNNNYNRANGLRVAEMTCRLRFCPRRWRGLEFNVCWFLSADRRKQWVGWTRDRNRMLHCKDKKWRALDRSKGVLGEQLTWSWLPQEVLFLGWWFIKYTFERWFWKCTRVDLEQYS